MVQTKKTIYFLIGLLFFITILTEPSDARSRRHRRNVYEDRRPSNAEEGDDAYDPFADYSEFEHETDEEEDINFFRNGRMVNLGMYGGYQMHTGNLGQKVSNGIKYGLFITYFFDLRFALQFSYITGNYSTLFQSSNKYLEGNANFTATSFNVKYYFNTQNVTRGLADLNPYTIFGFSNNYKTLTFNSVTGHTKEGALGFDGGVGMEIPMLRRKMYFGMQFTYHHVNFKDGTVPFVYDGENYGLQNGNFMDIMGLIGINF
jgi:hypothetical protein